MIVETIVLIVDIHALFGKKDAFRKIISKPGDNRFQARKDSCLHRPFAMTESNAFSVNNRAWSKQWFLYERLCYMCACLCVWTK